MAFIFTYGEKNKEGAELLLASRKEYEGKYFSFSTQNSKRWLCVILW